MIIIGNLIGKKIIKILRKQQNLNNHHYSKQKTTRTISSIIKNINVDTYSDSFCITQLFFIQNPRKRLINFKKELQSYNNQDDAISQIYNYCLRMDKGNQELSLILKKIAQNLILGTFQELKDIGNQLPQSIGEPILTITNLYQNNIEQSDRLQNDVFFYRDLIKAINKGNLSEEIIDNRYDIVEEKRNQALSLLMRFKKLEKMRINLQAEVSQKEIQAEKAHSSSKIILEKDFMETKSKMTKQLTTYEEEITTLKHMIQSQAEMIKDSLENGEAIQQKMKQKESENRQLNAQLRIFQKQISQLQRRFRSINTDLQQSKILQTQATIESRILCKQIEQRQQKITFMKNLQDQYKSVISNRQEENRSLRLDMAELKSQMEEIKESKQVRRKSNKDLFIDKNSIIQMVKKDQKIADCFHQTLLAKVGQVGAMSSLYNYSLHKGQNFHKRVDNKKNTLLLCLTKDKRILGGFSSSGFSLKKEDRNTKAFLFSFCADTMKVFDLKRGKSSTLYDRDFLIFGNEELCIEKGSNKLTSRFVNAAASALHYQFDEYEEKQSFLSIKQKGCQSVDLQNFEILELSIKSD